MTALDRIHAEYIIIMALFMFGDISREMAIETLARLIDNLKVGDPIP